MTPTFGDEKPGVEYVDRPGSYGIVLNDRKDVCIVTAPSGVALPGGGSHDGETPIATLRREVIEETGFTLDVLTEIGVAEQFLFAEGEGHFRKICRYFLCTIRPGAAEVSEVDHQVCWCKKKEALDMFEFESSHTWALQQSMELC